ncbi:unnamed protein product [Staurois parvus]|uniref:Uncharacterized protein n=1 Tax=Staurois parvus TaxID=386267 RepID=A0ABN9BYM8_9NEOB|nr:unnamed protein product [Staurois parvus]
MKLCAELPGASLGRCGGCPLYRVTPTARGDTEPAPQKGKL